MRDLLKRSLIYFIASAVSVVIAIAALPLATRILNPVDYGTYAVAVSFSAIAQSVVGALHTYLLPPHLGTVDKLRRSQLLSTVMVNAIGTSILLACCGGIVATFVVAHSTSPDALPQGGLVLIVLATICIAPWMVAADALPLDGRAKAFAAINMMQSLASTSALLVALYGLKIGPLSLYVGYFASSFIAGLLSLFALRHDLRPKYSMDWLKEGRRTAVFAFGQRVTETGISMLERTVLAATVGARSVGLYTHAQTYSSAVMMVVNALSRSLMPVSIREAREESPAFPVTSAAWIPVQLLVVSASIAFALIGDQVIALLTHGKFTDAHFLAYLLLFALALQTAGKCEISLLIARGFGETYARINMLSVAVGAVALVILVPLFGSVGAPCAVILRVATIRIAVTARVLPRHNIGFRDGPLLAGLFFSAATALWVFGFAPSLFLRELATIPVLAATIVLMYRTGRTLWSVSS